MSVIVQAQSMCSMVCRNQHKNEAPNQGRGPSLFIRLVDKVLASNRLKGRLWKYWYRHVDNTLKDRPVYFMNYGYAPHDGQTLSLHGDDQENHIYIQLYHDVAAAVDLTGLDVMEMSCGRGGGASYIKRYLSPRSVVAVDRTETAMAFCKRHHVEAGLRFVCGDALRMPFPDRSFDAIVNVEASHCYPDLGKFFSEVKRVLKPRGCFLYADFRKRQECEPWHQQVMQSRLRIAQEEDITSNVAKGLDQNHARTSALIREVIPRPLQSLFYQFAGARGSVIYKAFDSGALRYLRYLLVNDR